MKMRKVTKENIIDLSRGIEDEMKVWPGSAQPVFEWLLSFDQDGCNVSKVSMDVHTGTHVDAPKHFIKDGLPIDELLLDKVAGRAILYRASREPCGQIVTLAEVQKANIEVKNGDIFVLDTGIHKYDGTPKWFNFPTPEEELLYWLIEKGIKAYATDAQGVDPVSSENFPNHHILLPHGVPIIEGLTNLGGVPEAVPFMLMAFPLKLRGRDAAPCRAVAIIE